MIREASCSCGRIRLRGSGEPVRVSVFADPSFPQPRFSVYEERKHASVSFNEAAPIEHGD